MTVDAQQRIAELKAGILPTHLESIVILAQGSSFHEFQAYRLNSVDIHTEIDEVWGVNKVYEVCPGLDMLFVQDDLKYILNVREGEEWYDGLKHVDIPLVTSKAYPEWPMSVDYPMKSVLRQLFFHYINSTVAAALCMALACNPKKVGIFGADFTYPDRKSAEEKRACVEFWLGAYAQRGGATWLGKSSTLLDNRAGRPFYGYVTKPETGEVSFESIEKVLEGGRFQPQVVGEQISNPGKLAKKPDMVSGEPGRHTGGVAK